MREQQAHRQPLPQPARLAGLMSIVALAFLPGCGAEAPKPPEAVAQGPTTAAETKPAPAPSPAKTQAKPTRGRADLGPDMSVRERRALRKAGKLKD